jgi:hypothetical protein
MLAIVSFGIELAAELFKKGENRVCFYPMVSAIEPALRC